MKDSLPDYLAPAFIVLGVSALVLSGLGGMMSGQIHILFGAGVGFCLLMLLVPSMFVFDRLSLWAQSYIAAGCGALAGLCHHLYFVADGAWLGLLGHAVCGGVVMFLIYWTRVARSPSIWRDG